MNEQDTTQLAATGRGDALALAQQVLAQLSRRGLTLGTCESLTGGAIGAAITSVAGASKVFRGGLITYATDLKVSLAGVDAAAAAQFGVVNERSAKQMAVGATRACRCDVAVAVTGVAGPDPSDGQPVGTVWVGLALPPGWDEPIRARKLNLAGDRGQIRAQTTSAALSWLAEVLS